MCVCVCVGVSVSVCVLCVYVCVCLVMIVSQMPKTGMRVMGERKGRRAQERDVVGKAERADAGVRVRVGLGDVRIWLGFL